MLSLFKSISNDFLKIFNYVFVIVLQVFVNSQFGKERTPDKMSYAVNPAALLALPHIVFVFPVRGKVAFYSL